MVIIVKVKHKKSDNCMGVSIFCLHTYNPYLLIEMYQINHIIDVQLIGKVFRSKSLRLKIFWTVVDSVTEHCIPSPYSGKDRLSEKKSIFFTKTRSTTAFPQSSLKGGPHGICDQWQRILSRKTRPEIAAFRQSAQSSCNTYPSPAISFIISLNSSYYRS